MVQKLERVVPKHCIIFWREAIFSGIEMSPRRSSVREALERKGYSKERIGEILDLYAPSEKGKKKIFISQ
jgi:hypothetical protein